MRAACGCNAAAGPCSDLRALQDDYARACLATEGDTRPDTIAARRRAGLSHAIRTHRDRAGIDLDTELRWRDAACRAAAREPGAA